MTTYTIRQILTGDTVGPFLPDFMNLNVSGILSDVGSISFDYARSGQNYAWLEDQREIAIFDDSGEIDNGRFVIEGSNTVIASADGNPYRKFSGRAVSKAFEESKVYASSWPSSTAGTELYQEFTNATPGEMLLALFNKSKQFSEMNRIDPTWTFTATVDSEGVAWPTRYSMRFDQGTDLLAVLRSMVDSGMIEFYMRKRVPYLTVPVSAGTDRTTQTPPLTFWNGRNVIEVPEKTDSTKIRTVALLKGDDNLWKEVQTNDAAAVAKYGRRVITLDMGGTEATSMETIGRATLDAQANPLVERTFKYHLANFGPNDPAPAPFRQYGLGDWVYEEEVNGSLSRVRVRQATIEVENTDANGTVTLTLNSMILENNILIARKLVSQSKGASGAPATPPSTNPPPEYVPDALAPAKVTGVTVGSTPYVDSITGFPFTTADIQWNAVTTNSDGSAINDLYQYQVQYKYNPDPADRFGDGAIAAGSATRAFIDRMGQGAIINVRVRAVDKSGNTGEWSDVVTATLTGDTTPPNTPSTLVASPEMGNVRLYWDGLDSAGGPMPADFEYIEIYRGSNSTFTVAQGQMVGQLFASGYYWFSNSTYGTADFFRARSKDLAGNWSALNTASSTTAVPLVEADIANAAITTQKIADLAITLNKVANGAITETKIADDAITTPKIYAGAVTAAEMATGTITAASGIIGDAAIVTAKIADLAVNNAKIANATIQDAKIANLSVGKLTAGTLSADVIVGGNIMTATSGQRVVINSTGVKAYDSGGNLVVNITGSTNTFKGAVRATTFYSAGYDTGGSRYIEIGDVGGTESNDEMRFWNGSTVSSIRNPAAYTGRLRLSANSSGTTGTVDIDSIGGVMADRHTMSSTTTSAPWIDGNSGFVTVWAGPSRGSSNARLFLGGVNDHGWIASIAAGMKLLNSSASVQSRSSDDGSYGNFQAANFVQQSGSQFKDSIADLNIDALDAISKARLKVWRWKAEDGKVLDRDGIGLLVDDLPHWLLRGSDESYEMSAMIGLLWEAVRQVNEKLEAAA